MAAPDAADRGAAVRKFTRWASHSLWMRVRRKIERLLARRGLELAPIVSDFQGGYRENPPVSPTKLSEYIEEAHRRGEAGGGHAIECPEALVINKTVARFIGSARRIVNVGSVSAAFERFVAVDRSLKLVANVRDETFADWARGASSHENVSYCPGGTSTLLEEYGRFDLALAIDVIDRQQDYSGFLRDLSQLSGRVIVTISNKARDHQSLISPRPLDPGRIREWTAGEFYWVLKGHFDEVELYGMPDPVVPHAVAVGLLSELSPLIAICRGS